MLMICIRSYGTSLQSNLYLKNRTTETEYTKWQETAHHRKKSGISWSGSLPDTYDSLIRIPSISTVQIAAHIFSIKVLIGTDKLECTGTNIVFYCFARGYEELYSRCLLHIKVIYLDFSLFKNIFVAPIQKFTLNIYSFYPDEFLMLKYLTGKFCS